MKNSNNHLIEIFRLMHKKWKTQIIISLKYLDWRNSNNHLIEIFRLMHKKMKTSNNHVIKIFRLTLLRIIIWLKYLDWCIRKWKQTQSSHWNALDWSIRKLMSKYLLTYLDVYWKLIHTFSRAWQSQLSLHSWQIVDQCSFWKIMLKKSKKEGKDQEWIQSSTTPDPGYQWESDNVTIKVKI